jgi:hypothetical protein
VTCPAGKRALAGGGDTDRLDLMITDIRNNGNSLTVRWEFDNNLVDNASTDAWALCAPIT